MTTLILIVGKGKQVVQWSWWPKANTWHQCRLNVGYWSADCKAWFQNRLEAICSGKATLLSASEWWEKLKYKSSHTGIFTRSLALLADKVLKGEVNYWKPDN
jgi:hypothetical protein